jgi:hypothetical protein
LLLLPVTESPLLPFRPSESAPSPAASTPPEKPAPWALLPGELADLYLLALVAQGTDLGVSAAPELVEKPAQILPDKLRRAATKASRLALERLQPPTDYLPAEPPGSIPQQRIDALQQAIGRGDTLRVWYRKTGQHAAERRRLTPCSSSSAASACT